MPCAFLFGFHSLKLNRLSLARIYKLLRIIKKFIGLKVRIGYYTHLNIAINNILLNGLAIVHWVDESGGKNSDGKRA